jgi:hypothetical protein
MPDISAVEIAGTQLPTHPDFAKTTTSFAVGGTQNSTCSNPSNSVATE